MAERGQVSHMTGSAAPKGSASDQSSTYGRRVERFLLVALVVVAVALVVTVVSSVTASHAPRASSAESWYDPTARRDVAELSTAFFTVAHVKGVVTAPLCANVATAEASLKTHLALPHTGDQKALLHGLAWIEQGLPDCTTLARLNAAGTPPPRDQNSFGLYFSAGWGDLRRALASAGLQVPLMTQQVTD
jgi:hypothetical protein